MKTLRKSIFSAVILLVCSAAISFASGAAATIQKTYSWKYNINKDGNIVLDNYDCNIVIHTWDKAETEYHLIVDATPRSESDAAALDNYINNLKFQSSASSVKFYNTFWENRNNIFGRMTMRLNGGQEIALSEFKMKAELWIPAACRFELIAKYSEINLEDLTGALKLDLYNDNLSAGNVSGALTLDDKYSTMEFKDISDLKATLYSSKFESGKAGVINVDTKYTRFVAASCSGLTVESYNDKYSIPLTGDVSFTAKYSDLRTVKSGKVKLDCYEGSVAITEAKDLTINTKYADFQIGKAENITIGSSYNDKLTADVIKSLSANDSKYCNYRVGQLLNTFSISDGYEDKINIAKVGQEFAGININGKYTEVNLALPENLGYRFKAKITYPKLDINESSFKPLVKIKDDSNLEYDAVKGNPKDGKPVIEVNGYQMALKITEI